MNDDLRELYQEVILDHSRRPRNRGELGEGAVHVHGDNPSCGDELDLWIRFSADGGIEDIKFSGQGCAISQASASMMTTRVKGRASAEVTRVAGAVHAMLTAPTVSVRRASWSGRAIWASFSCSKACAISRSGSSAPPSAGAPWRKRCGFTPPARAPGRRPRKREAGCTNPGKPLGRGWSSLRKTTTLRSR